MRDQGELPIVAGQQGRETADAPGLRDREVVVGEAASALAAHDLGEGLGIVDEVGDERRVDVGVCDVHALGLERLLDATEEF